MPKYKLLYTKTAFKDIQKLDVVSRKRLKKKIEQYSREPLVYAKRLTRLSIGTYRWRVGSYRIVFDMKEKMIIVLRVGHRREIYK